MSNNKYSTCVEKSAKAIGKNLPISTKQSIEICNFIRGKRVNRSIRMLEQVITKEIPVPFKRFTGDVGHRKGHIASGRYPIKATTEILKLLKSAKKNAINLGMGEELKIYHINAHQGPRQMHYGRQSRRVQKKTHVEIILTEVKK